jgi:hypothetical protein
LFQNWLSPSFAASSTLQFFARPSSAAFDATGVVAPAPDEIENDFAFV